MVRASDVERVARERGSLPSSTSAAARFLGEPLDPGADWDAVLQTPWHSELQAHLLQLRRRTRARFLRHVPLGTLLHERKQLAREQGFGEGTSVYDECLILGDVELGAHAPLRIGEHSSIGAGAHVYTHDTIDRTLTGTPLPPRAQPTTIGRCCLLSPACIIGPGTTLGDHCFVAAHSYVQGAFPAFSYLAGAPARRVGRVET